MIDIPLPDAEGRRQLFAINLEKTQVAADVDFGRLVQATEVELRELSV